MIEPARRAYDAETRRALDELFGPPERWGATTRSLALAPGADVSSREFTGATTFRLAVPCSYDLELVAAKYFYVAARRRGAAGFNFNGTIHYRGDDGRLQMSLVPWSCSAEFRMPTSRRGATLIEHHYPNRGWIGVSDDDARGAAAREGAARRCRRWTRASPRCSRRRRGERRASSALVDSLLYEGYALYPYTPGATKNATPTPFGIVYPPAYADGRSTFDHLVVDCVRRGGAGRAARAPRCASCSRRRAPRGEPRSSRCRRPRSAASRSASTRSSRPRRAAAARCARRSPTREDGERVRVTLRVENRTTAPAGDGPRAPRCARSLLSTHPLLRLAAGPLRLAARGRRRTARSVNTWPVLASAAATT